MLVICKVLRATDFLKRFYLFERDRGNTRRGEAEGEADSLLSREPKVGLDPRTLGS